MTKKQTLPDTWIYSDQGDKMSFEKSTGFLYIGQEQYALKLVRWIDWSETTIHVTIGDTVVGLDCHALGSGPAVRWLQKQITRDSVMRLRGEIAGMATFNVYNLKPDLLCLYHNAPESTRAFEVMRGNVTTVQVIEDGAPVKKSYYLNDVNDKRTFTLAYTTRELVAKKQAVDVQTLLKPKRNASGFNFPIRGSHPT
jgi:hypothetical protein